MAPKPPSPTGDAKYVVTRLDIGRGLDVNDAEQLINVKVDDKTIHINAEGALEAPLPDIGIYFKYTSKFTKASQTVVIKHDVTDVAYTIVRVVSQDGKSVYHPHSPTIAEQYQANENIVEKSVSISKSWLASKLNNATIEVFVYPA